MEKGFLVQLSPDQPLTPNGQSSQRILEMTVRAGAKAELFPRPRINLALVLDRSGSMSGEKLDYVKQAARHVVDMLDDGSKLALVSYDDQVQVIAHGTSLNNDQRRVITQEISRIHTGGSTNLSGGWLAGCQEVAQAMGEGMVNRTLLLTDGLANVGITDPEELARHSGELAGRGVLTSTFGVGTGFNQYLLEKMANQGDGRFYYIECAEDIPNIFRQEFEKLVEIAAGNIELIIRYPESWHITVPGDWAVVHDSPGQLALRIGVIGAGRSKEIYASFTIPAGEPGDYSISVTARATDPHGALLEDSVEQVIRAVPEAELAGVPVNKQVLERYARVDLANQVAESLKLEQHGERKRAHDALAQKLHEHHDRIDQSLQDDYIKLSQRMAQGMDEYDRKRSHADSYLQKQRRAETERYPLLKRVFGHLVLNVHGHLALIDTGSPVSIGVRSAWQFMGRHLELQPEFMGVTIDYLRKVIGAPIDFLLGMDVLHQLFLEIDANNGEVIVSQEPLSEWSAPVRLNYVMRVPAAEFSIAEDQRKVFIDTSAKLSYISSRAVAGLQSVDTERDFYPGFGEFETEVYQVPLEVNGEIVTLRCGVLPSLLEQSLLLSGVEGILGTELFQYFRVSLALPAGKMYLRRLSL